MLTELLIYELQTLLNMIQAGKITQKLAAQSAKRHDKRETVGKRRPSSTTNQKSTKIRNSLYTISTEVRLILY